ncbi:MAG: ABC transporter substrate-binding protein [Firmicutes bacterium]|jgi:ABC-type transport system substrate-binding protein|nr:ABC transporter substrate-binding protein [Bacillota bacterium]
MKKKLFATILIFVMILTCFAGCSSNGNDNNPGGGSAVNYDDGFGENVLRITYDHECETGDPRQTTADYIIPMNIFDTLVMTVSTEDGGSELQPGAAETWEISEDGKTYSMHLRQGIKFTNGEELTADDVLYTVDSMLDPERSTLNSPWMDMLVGAQDVLDGKATTVEGKGVIIHDDYNFDLVLNESYAPFLATLSVPGWSILNREACDAADEAGGGKTGSFFGSEPEYTIGSGPFILKEWVLNDHIYLEANPDYWQGAPKIDGVLIKVVSDSDTEKMMFDQGQTDIFDLDNARHLISEYTASDQWKDCIVPKVTFGTTYLAINENIEPFEDVRVRKALQMSLDKQIILDTLYEGTGVIAHGIFPESMVGYNENLPEIPYDVEAAKKLMDEAGYADGFEMTIAMSSSDGNSTLELLQIIQEQWKAINVTVNIDQMDEASWYDVRATGELPMYTATWWGDFNDPDNFIYTFFSSASTKTRSFNYYNKDAIARIEAARHIIDEDVRMEEYRELEQLVIQEDAAWIPLFHLQKIRVVQPRVKGFVPHWAGWGDCSYYSVELTPAA